MQVSQSSMTIPVQSPQGQGRSHVQIGGLQASIYNEPLSSIRTVSANSVELGGIRPQMYIDYLL